MLNYSFLERAHFWIPKSNSIVYSWIQKKEKSSTVCLSGFAMLSEGYIAINRAIVLCNFNSLSEMRGQEQSDNFSPVKEFLAKSRFDFHSFLITMTTSHLLAVDCVPGTY